VKRARIAKAPGEGLRDALRTWKRLMGFHRPRALLFAVTILFMALSAAFNGLSLATIVPFTEVVLRGGAQAAADSAAAAAGEVSADPGQQARKLDDLRGRLEGIFMRLVAGRDRVETLARFCVLLVMIFLLKNICWYVQSYLSVFIEQTVVRDIRDRIFASYQALSLDYFQGMHSGVLVSRITNDADLSRGAVANGLMELLRHIFTLVTCIALVLIANAQLFLWSILILTPSTLLINQIGQALRRISRVSQERMAAITSVVGETVRGIRIIKAFNIETHQAQRFMRETAGYCRTLVRMTRIGSLGMPLTEVLAVIVTAMLIYIGGRRIILEQTPPGYFLLFLIAFLSMIHPIKGIHQLNVYIQHGLAAGRRIFEVIDTVPTVRESATPRPVSGFTRAIELRSVDFAYEPNRPVLHAVELTIPHGRMVALVGPSGSGKSTLVSLLPRFYDPTAGSVLLDGVDLREVALTDLRAQIGIVTQETVLFQDTIAGNIRLGRLEASDEEVIAAAKAANAHDFILSLPDGYETLIGERGLRLSGGERQRITIARAVLKNPPILVLDEATSALDTQSERLVQGAFQNLLVGRTAVVIAHRLSTVRRADQIVVMDKGHIVEAGTHEQLLEIGGLYRRLHEMQFAG
jgi:ATP-binding cassette, subfamily B, bacterial MsbA